MSPGGNPWQSRARTMPARPFATSPGVVLIALRTLSGEAVAVGPVDSMLVDCPSPEVRPDEKAGEDCRALRGERLVVFFDPAPPPPQLPARLRSACVLRGPRRRFGASSRRAP